jgi:uncharacterized membrane protein
MVKQAVINTICALPEDVSIEEIMYRLYVMDNHRKALEDIECGRVYGTDEIRSSIIKAS